MNHSTTGGCSRARRREGGLAGAGKTDGHHQILGVVGWLAAVAAVVWAVFVCRVSDVKDEEPGCCLLDACARRRSRSPAKTGADRPAAAERQGQKRKARGAKHETIADEWNADSLYRLLGNVPGETAALAKKIHSAFTAKDFDKLMECVDEALECKNPVVRAMMASSLKYYAGYSSLPEDENCLSLETSFGEISSGNWRKAGEDDLQRLRSVIPAASRFLSDENAMVRQFAAKAWINGLMRADAGETRLEAAREFFTKGDEAVLDAFCQMRPMEVAAFCCLENESKAAWAKMLSSAIEKPIDDDYAEVARYMYKELMHEDYVGQADTDNVLTWMADVEKFARERYNDPQDEADLLSFTTGPRKGLFDDRARDIFGEIHSEFSTARAAICAAQAISTLEKSVSGQYGDGEEAEAELAKKIDEVMSTMKEQDANELKLRQKQMEKAK